MSYIANGGRQDSAAKRFNAIMPPGGMIMYAILTTIILEEKINTNTSVILVH